MARTARARMLSPSISVSERVNELSLKGALLYTWMIAHADDQGRMSGVTKTLKARVVPMRDDVTKSDIDVLLEEMLEQELIKIYDDDGPVIQLLGWQDFQHLRSPKPSRHRPPEGWHDRLGDRQQRDDYGRFTAGFEK